MKNGRTGLSSKPIRRGAHGQQRYGAAFTLDNTGQEETISGRRARGLAIKDKNSDLRGQLLIRLGVVQTRERLL